MTSTIASKTKGLIFNIQKFSLHDGPGIRTVVFFKGCPLRCYWCSNPESQLGAQEEMWDNNKKALTTVGEYKTVDEIMEEVMKDEPFYQESGGGVTLSGGEVLFQSDFAIELLKALREKSIHTACETSGSIKPAIFNEFINNVDMVYMDLKHHDSEKHKEGTGVKNNIIIKNIQTAVANHNHLIIRIPVIPDFNDSLEDAANFSDLFNSIGVKSVELLPFHQFGSQKYKYLNREYKLEGVPQKHSEDLYDYKRVMNEKGIECLVH